ncbi:uncharacterized protein LOC129766220 [Toxorhynchites rutilus septentrionalis]|uniref:uncharacterized protein LOC129766220 n=1 Tax=Toxorhynchites rutilus septentrionalis TaxID=329112 RepID=UPI00247B1502|nr:uncharacterized protein LOC129766220 [Toxorhynchites rutilus septentrionalis]
MQTILSAVIFAIIANAAVDSLQIYRSKSVGKRDLWDFGSHTESGSEDQEEGKLSLDDFQHDYLRVPVHPVHEWHQDEPHSKKDAREWKPVESKSHGVSTYSKKSNKEERTEEEWQDDKLDEPEKGEEHHHHHHHHHLVKVIEVPKPYPVHVEKPYPVYVEKPVVVEKAVPLKLYITKKYH